MRKIKFRAWSKLTKEMSVVCDLANWLYTERGLSIEDAKKLHPYHDDFMHFMEFTGHVAEKGGEIYEGDIVSRLCNNPFCGVSHKGEVYFDEEFCVWSIRDKAGREYPMIVGDTGALMGITKLGNVYENPELLK